MWIASLLHANWLTMSKADCVPLRCLVQRPSYAPNILFFIRDQTRSSSSKPGGRTVKYFGHQAMSDGVWSPSISRLDRPCRAIVKAAVHWCVSLIIRYIGHPDDLFRIFQTKGDAIIIIITLSVHIYRFCFYTSENCHPYALKITSCL